MTVTSDSSLRSLIQLIGPARSLREDIEKAINLELYKGTGDFAVKSFQSLQKSVFNLTNQDEYVASLSNNIPENAGDKEKYSMVLFSMGQLIAYMESQTGIAVGGASGGMHNNNSTSYTIKPFSVGAINLGNDNDPEEIKKIKKMLSDDEEEEEV